MSDYTYPTHTSSYLSHDIEIAMNKQTELMLNSSVAAILFLAGFVFACVFLKRESNIFRTMIEFIIYGVYGIAASSLLMVAAMGVAKFVSIFH